MIERYLYKKIISNLAKQKVSVLLGARRVGKTELLKKVYEYAGRDAMWLNGEDENAEALLAERSAANYKSLLQDKKLLIIDEAQYVPDIGRKVKLMIDEIKPLHIIITGSSAFDISQQSGEPLVGRNITYQMYPIAQTELTSTENLLVMREKLPERLIYGSYPELLSIESLGEKRKYLSELVNTYLFKDILAFENLRNPQKLKDLLVLIAYQLGSEISLDELGRNLQLSKNTVEKYLDLLAKTFVVYKRAGFSRNLRKEITKSSRWYFYDNGIRNALINAFNPLAIRQDVGMLWENYIMAERVKHNDYNERYVNSYFWRTYDQQEIDLIEDDGNNISAFEMKYTSQKVKTPVAFSKAYPDASYKVITREDYRDFIV